MAERPSTTAAPDGKLVREHLGGREDAFEILFRRYHDRLLRYLTKRVRSRDLAEDLAQDTMLRVLRFAETFDQDRPMWPWLKTVAYNVVVSHRRARPDVAERPLDDDSERGEPDPDLLRIEERGRLGPLLCRIPRRHRVALELRYVRCWTLDDVAEFFGLTDNACKQLLFRARRGARREFERASERARAAVGPG